VVSTAVRARHVDGSIVLEADTSRPVSLDTTVTVSGPAGEAIITVTGAVMAADPASGDDPPAAAPSMPAGRDTTPAPPAGDPGTEEDHGERHGRDGRGEDPAAAPTAPVEPGDRLTTSAQILLPVGAVAIVGLFGLAFGFQAEAYEMPYLPIYRPASAWIAVPGLIPVVATFLAATVLVVRSRARSVVGVALAAGAALTLLTLVTAWASRPVAAYSPPFIEWVLVLLPVAIVALGAATAVGAALRHGSITVSPWARARPGDVVPAAILAATVVVYAATSQPGDPSWATFAPIPRATSSMAVGVLAGALGVGVAAWLGRVRPRRAAGLTLLAWLATLLLARLWQLMTEQGRPHLSYQGGRIAWQVAATSAVIIVGIAWTTRPAKDGSPEPTMPAK
jgi:hypothetical protein